MDHVFEQVEKNIDNLVLGNADWTASATKEELEAARKGELHLRFWNGEVPGEWLKDIKGKRVLCLAGAGGLQAPLFACAALRGCGFYDIIILWKFAGMARRNETARLTRGKGR